MKPLKILKKNPSFQKAFASLGGSEIVSDEVASEIEQFTCELYGITKNNDKNSPPTVNDARY